MLTACGTSSAPSGDSAVSTSAAVASPTASAASATVSQPTTDAEVVTTEPVETVPTEAVIVSCQEGLGPVETYWSDGSATGWSEYCQHVHDRVLQAEVDANAGPRVAEQPSPEAPPTVWNQNTDTWVDENGDGTMQGYERCGLACGDAPTSGEIQTQDACERGSLTGEVCDRYR